MKRTFTALMAILFAIASLAGTPADFPAGAVKLKTQKDGDRFMLSIHWKQPSGHKYSVKAVKVTFEPSGTVPLVVFLKDLPRNQRESFLAGAAPVSTMESASLEEMAPKLSMELPKAMSGDTTVRVEYLAEEDGALSTILGAAMGFNDIGSINFTVVPEK